MRLLAFSNVIEATASRPGTIPTFLESTATAECWNCWAPEAEEPSDLCSLRHSLPSSDSLPLRQTPHHYAQNCPPLTFDPKALDPTNHAGLHMNLPFRELNVYMVITVGPCPLHFVTFQLHIKLCQGVTTPDMTQELSPWWKQTVSLEKFWHQIEVG